MTIFLKMIQVSLILLPFSLAAGLGKSVKLFSDGSFSLDERYRFSLTRYDSAWKPFPQSKMESASGYPKKSEKMFSLQGTFDRFEIEETVQALTEEKFQWKVHLKAGRTPVPCKMVFLGVELPLNKKIKLEVDGKTVLLSPTLLKKNVFSGKARQVKVRDPYGTFTVSGQFYLYCIGKFVRGEVEYYQLRFLPEEGRAESIRNWYLTLDFQYDFARYNVKSVPLNLSSVFNRSFRDDGKVPGWTGQGAEMDLRALKTGKHNFYNIRINTVDPDQNQGRSCLVLGRKFGPERTGVDIVSWPEEMKYLYLLHASAWPSVSRRPIGFLHFRYADGRSEKLAVAAGRDCGNWYRPVGGENAYLAWTGKVPSGDVGLYLSAFPLKGKLVHLEFLPASGDAVWMVAGAALADGRARFPLQDEFAIRRGTEWLPIHFRGTTAPGSPLDFSGFRDLPAGKYGHIVADANGHFVFEKAPGKRIRLLGPNLVGTANFPNRNDVEQFIRNAECLGYNTVRLHHFEEGLLDHKAADSLSIDPKKLDQFHFLIARLKERGFYVCLDLYASRKLKAGDNIPEFDGTGEFSMKNLVPVSSAAMRNWKTFARKVLCAKNPYTGLTLAEDPVLYSLNLVNENGLIGVWDSERTSVGVRKIYLRMFEEYLRKNSFPVDEKRVTRNGLFIEFLNSLQERCIREQMRFLKEELGLKALITDLNNYMLFTLAGLRSGLEHVDNHQYWDHPQFPLQRWRIPFVFHNRSSIDAEAAMPRELMATRVFGKPFTVTEFNFCVPNVWRVECPALLGGYAGLQDWDALYRFAWSHGITGMKNTDRILNHFDIVNNIQAQMAERILYMLFLRGDVKAAEEAYAFEFKPEQVRSLKGNSRTGHYPIDFQRIGLFARIGSLTEAMEIPGVKKIDPFLENWTNSLPDKTRAALEFLRKDGEITSVTKEITLNRAGKSMQIITPRSEVLTGSGWGNGVVIESVNRNKFQTVALLSLDGENLVDSRKILLIQLTDLANNEMRFEDKSRRILLSWGVLPQMLERGSAEMVLALPHRMRVVPLELDGTPAEREIPVEYREGRLRFRVATDLLPGGTLACLLTR